MDYTLNIVSKCRFFLYIKTFVGSEKVLENFSWGPGKSWIFFVSKRVGTLQKMTNNCVKRIRLECATHSIRHQTKFPWLLWHWSLDDTKGCKNSHPSSTLKFFGRPLGPGLIWSNVEKKIGDTKANCSNVRSVNQEKWFLGQQQDLEHWQRFDTASWDERKAYGP